MTSLQPPLCQANPTVTGRIFLITGGSQGLGLAIARVLKSQGAAGLILVSRSVEKGQAAVQELSSSNNSNDDSDDATNNVIVIHVPTDLNDVTQTESVVERAQILWNEKVAAAAATTTTSSSSSSAPPVAMHITGLVNAAATTVRGNLFTTTAAVFDEMFALNVRAPFLITQAVARHMRDHNLGREHSAAVVNITSCAAHGGAPFVMAYSASKAALVNLTKNNATELARYGIRVNAINMGWCFTDNENALQTAQTNADWIHRADAGVSLGRILRPHDVAVTVCFLLSAASAMTTGTVMDLHPEFPNGMLSSLDSDAR